MTGIREPAQDAAGPFAGAIVHDFNNLLTVILGCSEALMTELEDPRQRYLATLILQAAERGADVTRKMLALEDADEAAQAPSHGPMSEGTENILVVEDDDLVRAHVAAKLESLGYRVACAASGPEALAILTARDDIDLLFTDVIMPGMNGRELGEQAVARWPWLRLIYTSGYSGDVLMEDGRLLTGINLLSKPYTKSQLAAKVRQALDVIP